MEKRAVRIFISYAHEDEPYFKLLKDGIIKHTKNSQKFRWETWSDFAINPGQDWQDAIREQLMSCDFALLLVSAGFLSSDFIQQEEFAAFMQRQEQGHFRFFPILVGPCDPAQWQALYRRQFFTARGEQYGRPDRSGMLPYADLVSWSNDRRPLPNTNRDRYHLDLVRALETAMEAAFDDSSEPLLPARSAARRPEQHTPPRLQLGKLSFELDHTNETPDDRKLPLAMQTFRHLRGELDKRSTVEDLERTFLLGNQMTQLVIDEQNRLREKVYDSEHLKKLYIQVHFNEIVFERNLKYNTDKAIKEKRQQRSRFPWYERSLIVSALTLGALQDFNENKIYHLIDFVRDREDFVWKRALVGLILVLLTHEERLSEHLLEDLQILQEDEEIQQGIIKVEEALAREEDEKELEKYRMETGFDETFEFFEHAQHWFLPFYPENPVVRKKLRDRQLRQMLPNSTAWPLDVFKYAYCLNYHQRDRSKDEQAQQKLRRAQQQALNWYRWNQAKYPKDDAEIAYRKSGEYNTYVKELLFFLANYPEERFKEIRIERRSLYESSLSDILLTELYLLQAQVAHYYLNLKDYEQALPFLLNLEERFPDDCNLLHRISYSHFELENWDKAVAIQEKTLKLEPDNPKRWEWMAYYHWRREQYEKALEYCLKADEIAPNTIWTLHTIADCHDELGNKQKAIDFQHRVTELAPEEGERWGRLGYYYYENEDYEHTLEYRLLAEKLSPDMAWNLAGIAGAYNKLGDVEEAIDYQKRAAELESENAGRWAQLGYYYYENQDYENALKYRLKAEELDPKLAWNLASIAGAYNKLGHVEEAIDYQKRAAELEPENTGRWAQLGYYYYENQDYENALKYRLKAEELDPKLAWNLAGIAGAFDELGNLEEAIDYQKRAAALEPENASRWGGLGYYLARIGSLEEALKYRLKAETLDPGLSWNLVGIAEIYDSLDKTDKAIEYQSRVVELESPDALKLSKLGYYYLRQGNLEKALSCLQRGESIEPNSLPTLIGMAAIYEEQDNINKVEEYLDKALDIFPNDPIALSAKGQYLANNLMYKEASTFLLKSWELDSTDSTVLGEVVNCFVKLEEFETALKYQEEMIKIRPEISNSYKELGTINMLAGRTSEAVRNFDKALQLDLDKLEEKENNHYLLGSTAWTYFLKGELDQAKHYFELEIQQVEEPNITYHANMNLGHIALLEEKRGKAEQYYREAFVIAKNNHRVKRLMNGFEEDERIMVLKGINKADYWSLIQSIQADFA